uniref:DUF834 domain-containing protein n=1 Tax=Oryza nivara TaxID=4536 RepID=A0A0E0FUX5_ORYNI
MYYFCRMLFDLSCRPSPTGDWEATTSSALVSPSLLLCLAAVRAAAGKATRPQGRWRRGFVLALRHGRGTCSGAAEPARSDLAVEQPAAGLSGVAAVSGGGGSGVKALAAAEETARSAPGSGRTEAGGGDSDGGKGSEGMASVSAWRSGGRDGGSDEFAATAARATTAGRLRRVSSELDNGDKVWEDDEMAAGMEGQQRLLWWRRRWQGDGVGEPTAVSGGGGSGVEALAAAAEETARSGPGSGGTAAGGGVWWRGWRRRRGRQGDGVDEVNLAALAAEMEGWQGDGVGEANLAAPAAEPTPEEFGCRGDGGDELAATAARATTVGGLRRVPSELDDGEKGREDGEMAAGMEGQRWLWWWRPWLAGGVADGRIRPARQCLEEGLEAGLA